MTTENEKVLPGVAATNTAAAALQAKLDEAEKSRAENAKQLGVLVWLSSAVTSGAGALLVLLGGAALVVAGVYFLSDRAEAKGIEGGRLGVEAAKQVAKDLEEHKAFEATQHAWQQTMMLRQDANVTALMMERGIRTPLAGPPAPPAMFLPDGGVR